MQPSMSKSALLLLCQRWAADDMPKMSEEMSEETSYGIAFHALMACKLVNGVIDTDDEVLLSRVNQAHMILSDWLDSYEWTHRRAKLKIEQSIAWRVLSNSPSAYFECKPPDSSHTYPYDNRFFCGTGDLFVIPNDPDSPLLVLDHKTGDDDFSDPERLHQLWSLAAVAVKVYQRPSAHLAVLHAPMAGGIPTVYCTKKPVTGKRLNAYRRMVKSAWWRIGDGSLTPGDHCEGLYCPAYAQCPMRNVALVALKRSTTDALLSPEDVARVWEGGHEMVKVWESRLLPEIREYVTKHGDIPLRGGKKITLIPNKAQTTLSFTSIDEALKRAKAEGDTKRVAGIVKLLDDVKKLDVTKISEKRDSLTTRKDG